MPRDYANSTNKNTKPANQPAGWVWMLGGLAIGLFVAFLVYLNNNTPPARKDALAKVVEQTLKDSHKEPEHKTPKPTPGNETPVSKPAPKFDFYYILPELEVTVPDQELSKPSEPNKTLAPNTDYILQAASFRSAEDADRLKAKLALQGVEANIQTVTINNDSWHRVRVGPIRDVATLNRTRKRLQESGITAIVIKAK